MMKTPEPYVGKWRITHMDEWDQEFVDLMVPGQVTIRKDGTGSFQFGAVQGEMDCRIDRAGGDPILVFSWDGSDECDPASGRGWVKVNGKQMEGHLFFHLGDDSAFMAKKTK
ncbi:MAG: hypothetical protein A2W03_15080 [Candidatus Aminicenantes bacterium RBG_16_63_16]|nr:MAG: hypothetical protein A2W03_15080 [Candidatus Aminicenantes bacterium RBG_16_63_16]HCS48303.1 hypothetical protein [Candidatus Aminicenantes bacterium]